MKPNPI